MNGCFRPALIACSVSWFAAVAGAQPIPYRCELPGSQRDAAVSMSLEVDNQARLVRVNGRAMTTIMAPAYFAGRDTGRDGLITVYRVDRRTGALAITAVRDFEAQSRRDGRCTPSTQEASGPF
ncbi:MAG: hypothetical protein REJ50_23835 [Bordetella sp.]|nr:hypothetical protein [Bordetella sp.]